MHESTPIAHAAGAHTVLPAEPARLADELATLRAHVERLDSVVELQREYIGRLRTFLLSFGDRRPDGRLVQIPELPERAVGPGSLRSVPASAVRTLRTRGSAGPEVEDDALAS